MAGRARVEALDDPSRVELANVLGVDFVRLRVLDGVVGVLELLVGFG